MDSFKSHQVFSLVIFVILLIPKIGSASHVEFWIKPTKTFRLQLFYKDSINRKWSESFTVFKHIQASTDYQYVQVKLKDRGLNNLRLDFGEVPDNEIAFKDLAIVLDSGDTVKWSSEELFEEFYINSQLIVLDVGNEEIRLKTTGLNRDRSFVDPFIFLIDKNNRLSCPKSESLLISIQLRGSNSNRISTSIIGPRGYRSAITKTYHPSGVDRVSFKFYCNQPNGRIAVALGDTHYSWYEIQAMSLTTEEFSRVLPGTRLPSYFKFNPWTEVSINDSVARIETVIFDGQYLPGFTSTRIIRSARMEAIQRYGVLPLMLLAVIFLFGLNRKLIGSEVLVRWLH